MMPGLSAGAPAWRMFRWFAVFAAVIGTVTQWWNGQEWWLSGAIDQSWDMGQWVRLRFQEVSR